MSYLERWFHKIIFHHVRLSFITCTTLMQFSNIEHSSAKHVVRCITVFLFSPFPINLSELQFCPQPDAFYRIALTHWTFTDFNSGLLTIWPQKTRTRLYCSWFFIEMYVCYFLRIPSYYVLLSIIYYFHLLEISECNSS